MPECLVVGGHRYLALNCHMRQKSLNLRLPHVARMPLIMKINELFHPVHVGFFRSKAIVQVTDLFPQLIQQQS
jgi:hypothetical protein